MTLTRFTSSLCLFALCLPLRLLWAQGVEPYPHAITNRLFYPKSKMAPPVVNSPFPDPDLGAMIVRVTDGNTNPQIPKASSATLRKTRMNGASTTVSFT